MEEVTKEFQEGYQACINGFFIDANPFCVDSDKRYDDWIEGWFQASEDSER